MFQTRFPEANIIKKPFSVRKTQDMYTFRLSESLSFSSFVDSCTIATFPFFTVFFFRRLLCTISSLDSTRRQMKVNFGEHGVLFTFRAVGKSLSTSSQPRLIIIAFCFKEPAFLSHEWYFGVRWQLRKRA